MSWAIQFPEEKYLGAVDVIPEGSHLKVEFETGVPEGTSAELSMTVEKDKYMDIPIIELNNDSESYGEVYVIIGGSEVPIIKDTEPGRTYYIDVRGIIGLVPVTGIILRAYTSATTTKKNIVEMKYSGRVISFLREE